MTVLEVRELTVRFRGEGSAALTVVEDVEFQLASGEVLGVLGESGSGKTTLAMALLGLLPTGGKIVRGQVNLGEKGDLLQMSERELRAIRGERISIIFQEPGLSLSPCLRAGDQVGDVVQAHRRWKSRRRRQYVLELLEQVGFARPEEIYTAYPHQLSGGQRQRIVIAQALACQPQILIADEPTAALDAITQKRIVDLLIDLKNRLGLALIFISHDAALLASLADRLLVMYAGEVVEQGASGQVYGGPAHPYTDALLQCSPRTKTPSEGAEPGLRGLLPVIPGSPADPGQWPPGCRFEPRCSKRMAECSRRRPAMRSSGPSHSARCLLYAGE